MTKADRDLIEQAAAATQQRVGTWARSLLVMMALWQLEGEVKLSPQHAALLKQLHAMGMNPVRKARKAVA